MRRTRKQDKRQLSAPRIGLIEALEQRTMLSASPGPMLHSDAVFLHRRDSTSTVQGFTPAQVQHAYGFDQVSFDSGNIAAQGQGQTIAIVDAYNDPNVQADVTVFDNQFSLPAPSSFRVVDQSGGSVLPATDSGWAGEIALDVEWAHAMAPRAAILLVEANSSSVQDLMAAVNYARHVSQVSVVSMSWGGSEFFSWDGKEFTGQTTYDPYFTTPSGHKGITFIAAAGDSGTFSGVQWPASSTNVLSVGGTSLQVQDLAGTYNGESSWSGTSGGYSQIEPQPSWQQNVQNGGARSTPDVAYDGDPNTGFAIYDSVPDQGQSGWQVVGGTSAGAPQWAALVAIADQGRVLAGLDTLDGASQTLPALYNLYAAPGTSGYSTYTSYFNDVIDVSQPPPFPWWFGGYGTSGQATAGYDTVTGLGTPRAAALIQALSGSAVTTTPIQQQQLPPSPITATVVNSPPVQVLGGRAGVLKLKLDNTGDLFDGSLSIDIYASTGTTLTSDQSPFTTVTISRIRLRAGATRTVVLHFQYPTDITDGTYNLIASVDAVGTNTTPAQALVARPVTITAPTVDLAVSFPATPPILVNPGHGGVVAVTIKNLGNVAARGTFSLALYASANQTLDPSTDLLLTQLATRAIRLGPNHSITLHLRFVAPTDQPGSYNLFAALTSSTNPADTDSSNDVASIGTR